MEDRLNFSNICIKMLIIMKVDWWLFNYLKKEPKYGEVLLNWNDFLQRCKVLSFLKMGQCFLSVSLRIPVIAFILLA